MFHLLISNLWLRKQQVLLQQLTLSEHGGTHLWEAETGRSLWVQGLPLLYRVLGQLGLLCQDPVSKKKEKKGSSHAHILKIISEHNSYFKYSQGFQNMYLSPPWLYKSRRLIEFQIWATHSKKCCSKPLSRMFEDYLDSTLTPKDQSSEVLKGSS